MDGPHEAGVHWIEGSRYDVTAQIVHDAPNAQVLDFGMLAYHFIGIEDPMHQPRTGAWVTGAINLSVDPFFYIDQLAHQEGFPALIYTWTVKEILQVVTTEPPHARAELVRIEETDVWADVSTSPSYLLRCRREPTPRSRVRSLHTP